MSTAKAIQVAVSHTAFGICVGSMIEGVLPKHNGGASLQQLLFETVIQIGLNGAALGMLSAYLMNDDPTYGIPFSMALFEAQPEVRMRISELGAAAKAMVVQVVQRMGPPVQAV